MCCYYSPKNLFVVSQQVCQFLLSSGCEELSDEFLKNPIPGQEIRVELIDVPFKDVYTRNNVKAYVEHPI